MQPISAVARSSFMVYSSPQESRVFLENRRMQASFMAIAAADPRIHFLGADPFVDQLIQAAGFDKNQVSAKRLFVSNLIRSAAGGPMTAILVSGRVWHRRWERMVLRDLVRQAKAERTRCIVVPQRSLIAPQRLASANLIAHSRSVKCTATERLIVVAHIQDQGWSSLGDCAALLPNHRDPVGAVLAMVARGDIRIDRTRRLGPYSRVDIAA